MSSEVNISDPALSPALRAEVDKLNKLDGGVPFRASLQHAHHTWARTFHSSPELYIQPESLEEVEKAITLARRCRKRITTVGCGHSPSDMTCTSSWMMNLDKFNKILSVNKEAGLVTMQAGIRLFQLGAELDKIGLAMPNLGSINEQSIAGAISTGTHGSTLRHSILSSSVTSLRITLASSRTLFCSPDENEELFRAALCSLGALGVITEITFQAVPAFTLHWSQTVYPDSHIIDNWKKDLWTQAEFVRVWWFPYTRRSTVWKASKTDDSPETMPYKPSYYDTKFGYTIYHNLLYLAHYAPRILPWVEWFVFGMQYGFSTGPKTTVEAIQPSREALLMNCLYSQYVNEWALPLHQGPTALHRLSSWLNHLKPTDPDYVEHGIPFSSDGIWVHAPIEVRVSDTTVALKNQDGTPRKSVRPFLDTTCNDGPTLYLNATLYRPYNMDPPCRVRYYQGFEYLMRELGGKPHWAKNFETTGEEFEQMYREDLEAFRAVRDEADPEGLFTGPWHRRYLLSDQKPRLELEEAECTRKPLPSGGVEVLGELTEHSEVADDADYVSKPVFDESKKIAAQQKKDADDKEAKLAFTKALEDSENLRLRLQHKLEEKLATDAAAEKVKLQIANDKAASDATAEENRIAEERTESDRLAAIVKQEEGDRVTALLAQNQRIQREKEEKLESDRLTAITKREEDDRLAAIAEKEQQESDRLASIEAQRAEADANELRLKQESDAKAQAELKEQQRIKREADDLAAREVESLRLKQESDAKAQAELKEQQRIKREADDLAAREVESLRLKQESDAKAQAEVEEQERMKREADDLAAREVELLRLKQESDAKAQAEVEEQERMKRAEQEAVLIARREKEAKRAKAEKAEKEIELAERRQKAESDRLAAVEKRKRDDEHNLKLAELEAQRLREEAADRHAMRQQQLQQAADARAKDEYEKRMIVEHDRREAAKVEASLKAKDEQDRISRVAHDNQVRLERGRLARESKEREEKLELARLAEDARQINKAREAEERRKHIQSKREAQRLSIQAKQLERKEAASQKRATEDAAARQALEQRALQDREAAAAAEKRREAIKMAFMAQVAARAKGIESPPKDQKNDTPAAKPRRSLSPQINGRPPTPSAAKAQESKIPRPTSNGSQPENTKQQTPEQNPSISDNKDDKSPRSAQKIFRPTIGTPTPSVLLAKREGLEPSAAPAQKRIKLEEEAERREGEHGDDK